MRLRFQLGFFCPLKKTGGGTGVFLLFLCWAATWTNGGAHALRLHNLRSSGGRTSHTLLSAKLMAKIDSGIAIAAYQLAMCLCAVSPVNATPMKKGASRQSTKHIDRLILLRLSVNESLRNGCGQSVRRGRSLRPLGSRVSLLDWPSGTSTLAQPTRCLLFVDEIASTASTGRRQCSRSAENTHRGPCEFDSNHRSAIQHCC